MSRWTARSWTICWKTRRAGGLSISSPSPSSSSSPSPSPSSSPSSFSLQVERNCEGAFQASYGPTGLVQCDFFIRALARSRLVTAIYLFNVNLITPRARSSLVTSLYLRRLWKSSSRGNIACTVAADGGNTNSVMEKRFPLFFAIFLFFQKSSFCMNNIQVDQYHEEAGGQRTVVRLGSNFSLSRLGNQNMQNDCCSPR